MHLKHVWCALSQNEKPKMTAAFHNQPFQRTNHSPNGISVQPVKKMTYDIKLFFNERELKWIHLLQTHFPLEFD